MEIILCLLLFISTIGFSQNHVEFGVSFGANATLSKTIQSSNMTWGYYTPCYPFTWDNHLFIGWGSEKDKIYAVYDSGSLGPSMRVTAYPNKYPLDDDIPDDGTSNMSVETGFGGASRKNTNLFKLSLLYKHSWYQKNKLKHKSVLGLGYFKTREVDANYSSIGGSGQYIDHLGWVTHGMKLDRYEYARLQNLYATLGYELTFELNDKWNINANMLYNQGFYKMIRWHTYRKYSESLTGYTEFDEQWSFTRLSHISLLLGVSYELESKSQRKK